MYIQTYICIYYIYMYIYIYTLGPGPGNRDSVPGRSPGPGPGPGPVGPGPGPLRTVLRTYLPYGIAYVPTARYCYSPVIPKKG